MMPTRFDLDGLQNDLRHSQAFQELIAPDSYASYMRDRIAARTGEKMAAMVDIQARAQEREVKWNVKDPAGGGFGVR